MLIHKVNSKVKKAETHEQKARLVPLSFTTEGSSDSKRISTDTILTLTSLPNIFMDMVASCTTRCRSAYIDRTRVQQRLKFILLPVVPRNLKFNSGDLIELFAKISTHKNNLLYGTFNSKAYQKNTD